MQKWDRYRHREEKDTNCVLWLYKLTNSYFAIISFIIFFFFLPIIVFSYTAVLLARLS